MAFRFFKEKPSGPQEIACPLCRHRQTESPLAVSSYCKGCGAYLTFDGGRIEARAKNVRNPFENRPPQPKVEISYTAREESGPIPVRPPASPPPPKPLGESPPATPVEKIVPEDPEKVVTPPPPVEESAPDSAAPEEAPPEPEPRPTTFVGSILAAGEKSSKKQLKTRKATCFECGDSHEANALANSAQCHKCGRMISLANHDIKSNWNSRIQTRGDVFIHKKGIVTGAAIQCHHLIVEGDFTGSAECSGDLILRRHGKIAGKVLCDRLLVEKRAKVEFLYPVETNECRIDGLVTGHISCRGRLSLEKKSTLTGNIRVGTLTVADGAKHTGQIQMGGF